MKDSFKMCGAFRLEARDAKTGRLLWAQRFDNQLTSINQTIRAQMLMGTYTGGADALQIKYFAFGDGTSGATAADTALENELLRKQITSISNPTTNTVTSVVSLGAAEANDFVIREIGVFCGSSASGAAGSGTLLSRVNTNVSKNDNMVLNVVRTDICTI